MVLSTCSIIPQGTEKEKWPTVQPEILAVIKFGGLPPNRVFVDLNLAVWNIHTCTWYI